ncbi:MAG: argininosuccinate lyase [Erysipelotrichaceae bacterium]|nr:argininosuccinate lyase [Erysipelotrichaceae bacterium]
MAKMWQSRFQKEEDELVNQFNASILFDQRLYHEDIMGSHAHANMLAKQGIISKDDNAKIQKGLQDIEWEIEAGKIDLDLRYEDIHMAVEEILTEKIGDAGKRLHTARSRNDQVATDMKLFAREKADEINELLFSLLQEIEKIIEDNTETFMPGFTHLQKAQPVTVSHHFAAYFEMFRRDRSRFSDLRERMNTCPLGAGALAGTTYPLDRTFTAEMLGFREPAANSMDAVSDRDYMIEMLAAMSLVQMHMSRSCEEICIWNSDDYRYVEIDDTYSTGSSIMPQKKNPDIAELIRGKTGRIYGTLMQMLTVMKGLPLAYNKDLQEDKEGFFDAVDTTILCLKLYTGMLGSLTFRRENLERASLQGFTNATDAADYLVRKGVPFRDAHRIIGNMVVDCLNKGCSLEDLPLESMRSFSEAFDQDIYEALSLKSCVERRNTEGAPGPAAMKKTIARNRACLEKN